MRKIILIPIALFCTNIYAQINNVNSGNQQWIQYYHSSKLTNKFYISSDIGFRFSNKFDDFSQFLIRAALERKIRKKYKLAVGCGYFTYFNNYKFTNKRELDKIEIRPFADFIITKKNKRLTKSVRIRLENRIYQNPGWTVWYNQIRFRTKILADIPIKIGSKSYFSNKLSLNTSYELLYQSYEINNRFIIGPIFKINKNNMISVYYMKTFELILFGFYPHNFYTKNIIWFSFTHN